MAYRFPFRSKTYGYAHSLSALHNCVYLAFRRMGVLSPYRNPSGAGLHSPKGAARPLCHPIHTMP